jgi:hypothetical protein
VDEKVRTLPVVIGATKNLTRLSEKYSEDIPSEHSRAGLHKMATQERAHILRN